MGRKPVKLTSERHVKRRDLNACARSEIFETYQPATQTKTPATGRMAQLSKIASCILILVIPFRDRQFASQVYCHIYRETVQISKYLYDKTMFG